jgi:hypothetical protein
MWNGFARRTLRMRSVLSVGGLLVTACCSSSSSSKLGTPASATAVKFWGDIQTTVSVKELMGDLMDPGSDLIFHAVGSEFTVDGERQWKPVTDEDWDKVRTGAVIMAEASQLLRVHRPWAPPGDLNNSVGQNATELSPNQIEAKVQADPVLWDAKVQVLQNVGREVLELVKNKDADRLLAAGEDLDEACETCHLTYWYPKVRPSSTTSPVGATGRSPVAQGHTPGSKRDERTVRRLPAQGECVMRPRAVHVQTTARQPSPYSSQ